MSNIRSFEKNKENPFLKEAIEQIQSGIVKKYKTLLEALETQFYRLLILMEN